MLAELLNNNSTISYVSVQGGMYQLYLDFDPTLPDSACFKL